LKINPEEIGEREGMQKENTWLRKRWILSESSFRGGEVDKRSNRVWQGKGNPATRGSKKQIKKERGGRKKKGKKSVRFPLKDAKDEQPKTSTPIKDKKGKSGNPITELRP